VIDISVTTRFKIIGSKRWEGESSYSSPFVVNSVQTESGEVVATIDSDLPIIGGALVLSGLKSVPGEKAGDPAMLRSGALGQQRSSQTNPSVRGCSHRNG